ncbi:MAG: DUF4872 domain-containing protein [Planctomycetota bacterium]|nr:DUF4872 domain-containing protein [Planctomycetota bacterium]
MKKPGEKYASSRRRVVAEPARKKASDPGVGHFPGKIAAATALRCLVTRAGVLTRPGGKPLSEAMVFGISGGIGAGVFSFHYAKESISTFFVAGRHLWHDDLAYLKAAAPRFGVSITVVESGGALTAERQLRDALAKTQPVIAWVDRASMPYSGAPRSLEGGGYHVVTVYRLYDKPGTVLIGDLARNPIEISQADFWKARARIKKQKNRLLHLDRASGKFDLSKAVAQGLRACRIALLSSKGPRKMPNFTLEAFRTWGERIHGSKAKDGWEKIFPVGPMLWDGLTHIHDFIEHNGTGGGLCRPLFAEFCAEASKALGNARLRRLGKRYADLGRRWSDLANAALTDSVPLFQRARELLARKAGGALGEPPSTDQRREIWAQLQDLRHEATRRFPLSAKQAEEIRADLQRRILDLYEKEVSAAKEMRKVIG